jgi:hypothetical protein
MYIVAVHDLPDNREPLAEILASALGKTLYETNARLRAPGPTPRIVAVFSDPAPAKRLVTELKKKGFSALQLGDTEFGTGNGQFAVKRFLLGEDRLAFESKEGEKKVMTYGDIRILIRGTAVSSSNEVETVKERKFDLGKAIMTNGLILTKKTTKTSQTTVETREGLLNLYTASAGPIVFLESDLSYDSLGSKLQPSRAANFNRLVAELRRKTPDARYDDSLLTHAGLTTLLGPGLNPEKHFQVALALVARVLRKKIG